MIKVDWEDIEDIKSKKDKLSEKAMGLAAKVYEQVNKERADEEGGGGEKRRIATKESNHYFSIRK